MALRPRFPLDDSWLFADPMALALVDDDDAQGMQFDDLDDDASSSVDAVGE